MFGLEEVYSDADKMEQVDELSQAELQDQIDASGRLGIGYKIGNCNGRITYTGWRHR